MVDEKFVALLTDVFGEDFLRQFKSSYPQDWLQLLMSFQAVKCGTKPDAASIRVQLPAWTLQELTEKVHGKKLDAVINSRGIEGVKFSNGLLVLGKQHVAMFFEPAVSATVKHVQKLLQSPQMKNCSFILLVGGFGNSPILFYGLTRAVKPPVLVPPEPQIAVLMGAVRFGLDAKAIRSRIARKTYGTSSGSFEILPYYRIEKITMTEDEKEYVEDLFELLVEKGSSVELASTIKFTAIPMFADEEEVVTDIVASEKPSSEIVHTDDLGVEKVGSITIAQPDVGAPLSKKTIDYEFTFGMTEIFVKAKDTLSGRVFETMVDFFAD